jgi:hypothetical protein
VIVRASNIEHHDGFDLIINVVMPHKNIMETPKTAVKKGKSTRPKLWGIFSKSTKELIAFSYSQRKARTLRAGSIALGFSESKDLTAPTKFRFTLIK